MPMTSGTKASIPAFQLFLDQDQDQDQAYSSRSRPRLWISKPRPVCDVYWRPTEQHSSFLAVNENADEYEIPFLAENENGHSLSAEKRQRKSPDNINILFSFSYIQSPSQPHNAPTIPRPVSPFCR